MNKIFFKEKTSLQTVKRILLQLNPNNVVGYKVFLPYKIFAKLKNFINNYVSNQYEFWVDITDDLDMNFDSNNAIFYYDYGRNPKLTNIIKVKTKMPLQKTMIAKVNLNTNTIKDILKIWNYECDIFIDEDDYSFEKIQEFFSVWKNKRNNYSKKILNFDNLFNNPNFSNFIFEIEDEKITIKNILNHSFSTEKTFKEIEETILSEEIFCEQCQNCHLQPYCKTFLNGYEGLQSFYTKDLSFNCKLTQFLLNSIQQIKEDADERFNFSRKVNQSM